MTIEPAQLTLPMIFDQGVQLPPLRWPSDWHFYRSPQWKLRRYSVLHKNSERNGGVACCDACGRAATRDNPLHVDHILPRSRYPHLELELSNLQVLCRDCNMGKSDRYSTDWQAKPPRPRHP